MRQAITELKTRAPGMPGMGLVYGATGMGKTTAATIAANTFNAAYVRANVTWTTPNAMLRDLAKALGGREHHSASRNLHEVVKLLQTTGRPLLIDEAEYVTKMRDTGLDAVRDLHDMSTVPIILIGMSERGSLSINKQIVGRERLAQIKRRIAYWVEFGPLDMDEARKVVETNCEVILDEGLLEHLYQRSHGRIGAFTVGLSKIEQFAIRNDLQSIGMADWTGELSIGEGR